MTTLARPTIHHVALTVTDLDASVRWYEQVFGLTTQMDAPHQGGVGKVLADESWQLMIALHRHDTADRALFRETRTGLDHAGFLVPSRTGAPARTRRDQGTCSGPSAHPVPDRGRALRLCPGVPRSGQHPA